jgi:hypothetical protein
MSILVQAMSKMMNLYVNATRNACRLGDEKRRRAEALRAVKLFHARNATQPVSDAMVPDFMVNDAMINRYLEIEPPQLRATTEFDVIIEEIEQAYVLGLFFSALSASVVAIERMLNTARIRLHPLASPKQKKLWGKQEIDTWQPNIDALTEWKLIPDELGKELSTLYSVRCKYLHSGEITSLQNDSVRAVKAAYSLLAELIGFPPRLFKFGNFGIECLDENDPLIVTFYTQATST